MNKAEYLLTCLSEECAEISQRAAKAQRFTLEECQPGIEPERSNAQRIVDEIHDLEAVIEMLYEEGFLPTPSVLDRHNAISAKRKKLKFYMAYSCQRGALKSEEGQN